MKKYLSKYLSNDYSLIENLFLTIALISFGGHILFYIVLKYGFSMQESLFLRLSIAVISLGFVFFNPRGKLYKYQLLYFEIVFTISLPVLFNILFFLNNFSPYWSASIFFAALLYGSMVNPVKALILWPIAFATSLLLLNSFYGFNLSPDAIITAFEINFGAYFLMFSLGVIQVVLTNAYKEMKKMNSQLKLKNIQLTEALDEVKQLKGLIPICASCKSIRDDKGYWNQIESYIERHSDAQFSHGICDKCAKKLYPEFM